MYVAFGKRMLDFSLALFTLVFFSWLLLLITFVYFCLGHFQVIFRQQRIGFLNRPFTIYKFKTLKAGEDEDIQSRRFWWGDVLRFLSLDEMPQLINILKGDMSFVGPRPLPLDYLELMNESQKKRQTVWPGIAGWAQVNGRHSLSWQKKFELDVYYVDHISFGLDVLILFKTIVLLLSFKKDQSLKEEKFRGN